MNLPRLLSATEAVLDDVAQRYGLKRRELERMASAFEHDDAELAGALAG